MASTSDVSKGPVLKLVTNRIRALNKKLRITENKKSGEIKNKEQQEPKDKEQQEPKDKKQEELVAIKAELEKLLDKLTPAVEEEIEISLKKVGGCDDVSKGKKSGSEKSGDDVSRGDDVAGKTGELVKDLLKVIYFGRVFNNVKKSEFGNIMLTRTNERNCCLTYDTGTDDDAAIVLNESDLDLLSEFSELLVSRPADSSFSHEVALSRCVEHANKWLAGSDERIGENLSITYAALREKLAKIIGSYYYQITPEPTPEQEAEDQLLEVAARIENGQSLVSISINLKIPLAHVRSIAELCIQIFRQGLKECEEPATDLFDFGSVVKISM